MYKELHEMTTRTTGVLNPGIEKMAPKVVPQATSPCCYDGGLEWNIYRFAYSGGRGGNVTT
jgi:hypothetical protein